MTSNIVTSNIVIRHWKQIFLVTAIVTFIAAASQRTVLAEETLDLRSARSIDSAPQLEREGNRLKIFLKDDVHASMLLPRIFASLRGGKAVGVESSTELVVQPETDHWVIRWDSTLVTARNIELLFDTPPQLESETDPIGQLGDGRLNLHAYQAKTTGEKLRFEPQAHKNTVGYWVNAKDFATWSIQVERPGKFNVGILQGCGAGQGGSEAVLSVHDGDRPSVQLEFTVEETGHFQNFIWRTIGVIEIPSDGQYTVQLRPKKIKQAALMDVRQIQLVRLP